MMFRYTIAMSAAALLCSITENVEAIRRRPNTRSQQSENDRSLQNTAWDEWYVGFDSAEAKFDGSSDPNVSLLYTAAKPFDGVKYYRIQVMDPTCSRFLLDNGAIMPADDGGAIPDSFYDDSTMQMEALLDIDTTKIESTSVFYTQGNSPEEFIVSFCARMELLNARDMVLASESTILTFNVDTTQEFAIDDLTFANEEITNEEETVVVDFPLNTFTCNDESEAVAPEAIFPGQPIQVCIESSSNDARVINLRSVRIQNDEDDELNIPLVDASSFASNRQTDLTCLNGVCNLKSLAFARLFEKPTEDGNIVDISATSKIMGTVMLELVSSSRRRKLNEETKETSVGSSNFEVPVDLATPPPSSSGWMTTLTKATGVAVASCLYLLL